MADNGGSLFLNSENKNYLRKNVFKNNWALEGGAIKYLLNKPDFIDNIFINNQAEYYGQNIASYPIRIKPIDEKEIKNLNFRPHNNQFMFKKLSFLFYDLEDEIFNVTSMDIYANLVIVENKTFFPILKIIGAGKSNLVNGLISFENILCSVYPLSLGQNISFIIDQNIIPQSLYKFNFSLTYSPNEFINQNKYFYQIFFQIINCKQGEIYDKNAYFCVECPFGKYSYNPNNSFCNNCPSEAIYCEKNNINLRSGYWFSSSNLRIYHCIPFFESCLGGNNSICKHGYDGPLCQSCIDGFSKSNNKCLQCNDKKYLIIFNLLFPWIMTTILLIISFKSNYSIYKNKNVNNINETKNKFLFSALNRIFIIHLQLLPMIKNLGFDINDFLLQFLQIQSVLGNAAEVSSNYDCLFSRNSQIPATYFITIIFMIAPFFYFFFILSFFLIIKLKHNIFNDLLTISGLVIIDTLQSPIINTMINSINCIDINGFEYLQIDFYNMCNNIEYTIYGLGISVPILIIWSFVYPVISLKFLFKNKKNLMKEDGEFLKKYGILFRDYKNKYKHISGPFLSIYKVTFIVIIFFLTTPIEHKCLVLLLLTGFCIYIISIKEPFLEKWSNFMFNISVKIVFISIFLKVLSQSINFFSFDFFSNIFIVIINIIFFGIFVYMIFKLKKNNFMNSSRIFLNKMKVSIYKMKASIIHDHTKKKSKRNFRK